LDHSCYPTGQFAKRAGVTVRTLRYYDKVGLLKPTRLTPAGHRLYTDHDLVRLQQILALKFLGFSLEQIKHFFSVLPTNVIEVLQLQKEMMYEKRRQIDKVIQTLEQACNVFDDQDPDWDYFLEVIRVVQQPDSWKQYYSEEAIRKLEERGKNYTSEDAQRDAKRWQEVISGFKKAFAAGLDPGSEEVQALAKKHHELVQEFTQGDPGITEGLKKMYSSPGRQCPNPYGSQEEHGYVKRALALYRERNL
jgi:DNA-binding transcriptional MerR regulator